MSVIELRVQNLDCEGCVAKIQRALYKIKGVEEIEVDMEREKVTVRGHALEEKKVVKRVKRSGKMAEPWPFPSYNNHFSSFYNFPPHVANHYYQITPSSSSSSSSSYNGIRSSSNGVHAFFHTPAAYSLAVGSHEEVATLFSDENPHACTIM